MNYTHLKLKNKNEKVQQKIYKFRIFGQVGSKYYNKEREKLLLKMDDLGISLEEE